MQKCFRPAFRFALRPSKGVPAISRPVRPIHSFLSSNRSFTNAVSAATLQCGQPVHETHPHLLKAGELTPGITALEYAQRRSKLAAKLPDKSIAVLSASDLKYRSGAVFFEFSQDPDFFYLTGFNEPEALAVIGKGENDNDHIFHLYVRPKDNKAEVWDGPRSGLEAAVDIFNADETGDINKLGKILPQILSSASEIYTDIPHKSQPLSTLFSRIFAPTSTKPDGLSKLFGSRNTKPLKDLLHDLRAFKSDAEITLMRSIGRASGRAFSQAMKMKWEYERDLMNFMEYQFKQRGCDTSAYIPVVAGGKNALSIHYTRNDSALRQGDLVLVDAGGEHGHYISDITRTFPVSTKFSPAQRDLYEAILSVQRTCVSLCRASASISLDKLHEIAEKGLRENLSSLGFDMSGKNLETLFPHHLGHYIGLDVHDTPGYSRQRPLKERQVVTVEPGIHVPDDDRWPAPFRGLGIQIEDSVVVGDEHPLVLSTEAVKEVVDIEALRAEQIDMERMERF